MVDSRDILLGIVGLLAAVYGGFENDLRVTIIGIATIFLTIQLNLQNQEEEIRKLKMGTRKNKAQLNPITIILLIIIIVFLYLWLKEKGYI